MKKTAILVLGMLLMISVNARADTRYVSDLTQITMRLGPGVDYRVIQTLKSGDTVDVMASKDGWTQVSTKDGKNGWVVSRYLTSEKPASAVMVELQKRIGPLQEQAAALKSQNDQLRQANKALTDQLDAAKTQLAAATAAYDNLAKNSKDYLKVKAENQKLRLETDRSKKRIDVLEKTVSNQSLSLGIKWFLAGAGVLIIGMLIGLSSRRKRSPLR